MKAQGEISQEIVHSPKAHRESNGATLFPSLQKLVLSCPSSSPRKRRPFSSASRSEFATHGGAEEVGLLPLPISHGPIPIAVALECGFKKTLFHDSLHGG